MTNVTQILESIDQGDPKAADELLPLVYDELSRLAQFKMNHESPGHTLQPTALVHEAWIRLAGSNQEWRDRRHFFNAAAESMRRILIERARRRGRLRRGGGEAQYIDLNQINLAVDASGDNLLVVDEALSRLAAHHADKAELVKLRYYVGFSIVEAAQALGISEASAKGLWTFARTWLYRELKNAG